MGGVGPFCTQSAAYLLGELYLLFVSSLNSMPLPGDSQVGAFRYFFRHAGYDRHEIPCLLRLIGDRGFWMELVMMSRRYSEYAKKIQFFIRPILAYDKLIGWVLLAIVNVRWSRRT